jgi:lipopolysaccharide biosynthesis glycosyltransferase
MFEKRPVIYVGFDKREKIAYDVLRSSIMEYNKKFDVIPLVQTALRRAGLYRRSARLDSIDGQRVMVDTFDGRPFSTEFTFTRFLIPALNQYEGLALFMDSDMFVKADIEEVFETYGSNKDIALHCVKRKDHTKERTLYYRWSLVCRMGT